MHLMFVSDEYPLNIMSSLSGLVTSWQCGSIFLTQSLVIDFSSFSGHFKSRCFEFDNLPVIHQ